jgi:F-type H+-transporting ATPase subunit a
MPVPVMLPFNILEYFIKPLSLALRLFGNILGAFIVMELIYMALPVVAPAALSLYFDLFDGVLQAYVFMLLTSLYIAEAVE